MALRRAALALSLVLGTACASVPAKGPAKGPSEFRTSLVQRGIEIPLVVRRDLLLLVLAMGGYDDDARVRASVRGLVTGLGLVVISFGKRSVSGPGYKCSSFWKVVVARADGQDFPTREVAVLATLRASPFIAAAGPLISPDGLLDHTIHVFGSYQPLPAALQDELQLHGLTLGSSERTIHLPTSIGIDVLTLARRFASLDPDREFWPGMGPTGTCTGR